MSDGDMPGYRSANVTFPPVPGIGSLAMSRWEVLRANRAPRAYATSNPTSARSAVFVQITAMVLYADARPHNVNPARRGHRHAKTRRRGSPFVAPLVLSTIGRFQGREKRNRPSKIMRKTENSLLVSGQSSDLHVPA